MGATETKRVADFPLFDWLRISMAMLVAAEHFSLVPWLEAGNLGVQIFFALSGWLIGTILIEMRSEKLSLFYFNRATRVWLPYFAAVIALYALSALRDPVNARWVEFLVYDLTFTHNFFTLLPDAAQALAVMPLQGTGNHFWSLAVEEQFYLAAPIIILFLPGGRHPLTWITVALIMLLVREEFSAIAFGVAAAAMHHIRPNYQRGPGVRIMLVLLLLGSGIWLFDRNIYPFVVPFFAISVVLLLAVPGARGPIGRFMGGVSYPLYLNHWIALVGVSSVNKHFGGNHVIWSCFGMVVAFGIGSIAYLLIDRPVMARRMTWFTPRIGWMLAATSYVLVGSGIVVGINLRVM